MRFILLVLFPILSFALSTSTVLKTVDGDHATAEIEQAQKGLSGFVVRHFNTEHSSIVARAEVIEPNTASGSIIAITPYEALEQNALPLGTWEAAPGDTLLLGNDYSRALLIAPDVDTYKHITGAFRSIEWVHPDRFAAYLSVTGHPSPTAEDFQSFCNDNIIGLLYFQLESTLFTLDCKNFTLLQTANAPVIGKETEQLPFYSRVETIRSALWGEGNDDLEYYAPHYLQLITDHNAEDPALRPFADALTAKPTPPLKQGNDYGYQTLKPVQKHRR